MSEPQTINLQPRVRHMELVQAALFSDFLGTPSYFWLIFISVVIGLLVLDTLVLDTTRMRCMQLPNEPLPVGRAGWLTSPCGALGLSKHIKPRLHRC